MQQLPREFEERYGVAKGIMLPVKVTSSQLDMLRAAESSSNTGINIMLAVFVGAKLVAHGQPHSHRYKFPEVRLDEELLDPEDFEAEVRSKFLEEYGIEIDLSRYIMLVQCTFLDDRGGEDLDPLTSSRTLHVFTAKMTGNDDWQSRLALGDDSPTRLVKPREMQDSLQSEWTDTKTQMSIGPVRYADLKGEYDASWTMVRARIGALIFQSLFGWELPEI